LPSMGERCVAPSTTGSELSSASSRHIPGRRQLDSISHVHQGQVPLSAVTEAAESRETQLSERTAAFHPVLRVNEFNIGVVIA